MPKLDPEMAAILEAMRARNLRPYTEMTPLEARVAQEERHRVWNEDPPAIAKIEERRIEGPFGARRLRLYDNAPNAGKRPAILWFHGGGWVIGSIDSHDIIARELARRSGLVVAAYDYALAPEHPFPEPLEDCIHVFRWLVGNAGALGIEAGRIGVGGDSAGAGLTLGLAIGERDGGRTAPGALALVYPAVTVDMNKPSVEAFGGGDYVLSQAMMRWFTNHHVPNSKDYDDPRVTLVNADLNGLPPIYLSVAELDPLLDDGDLLLERLKPTDTFVEYHRWRGVTHACLPMGRKLRQARRFQQAIADFFRRELDAAT